MLPANPKPGEGAASQKIGRELEAFNALPRCYPRTRNLVRVHPKELFLLLPAPCFLPLQLPRPQDGGGEPYSKNGGDRVTAYSQYGGERNGLEAEKAKVDLHDFLAGI